MSALVLADPVECPRCKGDGQWLNYLFDDVYVETCDTCGGKGTVSRCQREAYYIALFVMGLGVDAELVYTGRPGPWNADDMWYAWKVIVVENAR